MHVNVRDVSVWFFLASFISVLCSFFLGVEFSFRFSAVAYFTVLVLFVSVFGFNLSFLRNVFLSSLLFIFISGLFFGLVNYLVRDNSLVNLFIYSFIYLSKFLALYAGMFFLSKINDVSESDREHEILRFLMYLALADVLWALTRFFVLGLAIRTSFGFTYLLPMLLLYFSSKINVVFPVRFILFSSVSVFVLSIGLLSGLRSIMVFTLVLFIFSLIFTDKRTFLYFIFACIFFIVSIFVFYSIGYEFAFLLDTSLYRSVDIVVNRFSTTFFSDAGVRLDPNEGRYEESMHALEKFKSDIFLADYIFGRGFGFTFFDYSRLGEETAHIHITPIAFFIRSGVIGFLFYASILIYSFIFFIKSIFNFNKISIVLNFCFFLWSVSSLFAGMLVSPIYWLFFGIVYSFNKGYFLNGFRGV